jgi:hypothetical protein
MISLASALALPAFAGTTASAVSAQGSLVLDLPIRVTTVTAKSGLRRYVGVATWLRADSLGLLSDRTEHATPLSAIIRLEKSRGRHSNERFGAVIGVGVGLVLGLTALRGQEVDEHDELGGASAGGVVVLPLAMLASGGIGALAGRLIRTERWEEIPKESLRDGTYGTPSPE